MQDYHQFGQLKCHPKSIKRHQFPRSETEFVLNSHASGWGYPTFVLIRLAGGLQSRGLAESISWGSPHRLAHVDSRRIVPSCLRRHSPNRHPIFYLLIAPRSKARQPSSQSISIISHASQEGRRRCLDEESRCHPRSCLIQRSVVALYLHPTLSHCFADGSMLVANTC